MEIKNIWHIAREYRGIAEAGGIKDVVRDLSESLAATGIKVSAIIPLYGFMKPLEGSLLKFHDTFSIPFPGTNGETLHEPVEVFFCTIRDVRIYCLSSRFFSDKNAVYTYTHHDSTRNPDFRRGSGHNDAVTMSLFFQMAAVEFMVRTDDPPAIIHCHDGHTALIPAIIREHDSYRDFFSVSATVVTIHNAGPGYHQEIRNIGFLGQATHIPLDVLLRNVLHGAVNPFLLASGYSTLNTVSANYARELLEIQEYSFSAGLGRELYGRGIRIQGITNGVNPEYLDPRDMSLSGLPAAYDPSGDTVEGKRRCKLELLSQIRNRKIPHLLQLYGSLENDPELPLYVLQARLTYQKGISILIEALKILFTDNPGLQVLILGQGDQDLEEALIRLSDAQKSGGRFCFIHGYEEQFVKLLFASSDFFLIPSIYEPCGITDLFSLLAGTLPVVHKVGGLVKIENQVNGYTYDANIPEDLLSAIMRSRADYSGSRHRITEMRKNGFNMVLTRYSWDSIVRREYIPFYISCMNNPVYR